MEEGVGEQGAEDDIWRLRVTENKVLRRIFGEQGAEDNIWRRVLENKVLRTIFGG